MAKQRVPLIGLAWTERRQAVAA